MAQSQGNVERRHLRRSIREVPIAGVTTAARRSSPVITPGMNAGAQRELPPTTLIVCSRNRPRMLAETVASVLKGNELPTEILVIDQSDAPNETLASVTSNGSCEVRYLRTQSIGLSRGRNVGLAEAGYEIVALLDDDML